MNERRLLNTFLDLVKIDSPSTEERDVSNYCAGALRSAGCSVEFDTGGKASGSNTGNLYAVLDGDIEGSIIFTAHMDCISPCEGVKPIIENDIIHTDGTTVLGGDDKAGIAAIIEAVRSISESKASHPTIKIIFTVQEESGLYGAKSFNTGDFIDGEHCYVVDTTGKPGTLVIRGSYCYLFSAKFSGKTAHAGIEPEKGINAIAAASCAISKIHEKGGLGRVSKTCTSNIGSIESSNEAHNVVPQDCKIVGECRAMSGEENDKVRQIIESSINEAANEFGAKVEQKWELLYSGFSYDDDDPIVKAFVKATKACGFKPNLTETTGGSDANIFAGKGLSPVVVGIGMMSYHTVEEYIDVNDIYGVTRILRKLMTSSQAASE